MKPFISVVITTKNEEKYIEKCLSAIKHQTYRNIEIILVDSCSTDKTVKIARKFTKKIFIKKTSIAEGQNLGARNAKGDILIIGKSDVILQPDCIEKIVHNFDKNIVAVVCRFKAIERNWKSKILENLFDIAFLLSFLLKYPQPSGENILAVKRIVFEKIGGYDERLTSCEDNEIFKRLKRFGNIEYDRSNIVFSSFRRFEKQGYLKWLTLWLINYFYFIIFKRPLLKNYTRIDIHEKTK